MEEFFYFLNVEHVTKREEFLFLFLFFKCRACVHLSSAHGCPILSMPKYLFFYGGNKKMFKGDSDIP